MNAGLVFSGGRIGLLLATGSGLLAPAAALAQSVPTREQVEVTRPEAEPPASRVRVDSRAAIQQGPCPLRDSTVTIDLRSVKFETLDGSPVPAEFASLLGSVRPVTLGPQPVAIVCDLRDAANAALRGEGYIAGVQVPAQEITSGELRLAIVAGRITDITVRGDVGRFRDTLRPRIDQLKTLFPLNQRDIERVLLLAGDVPGLNASLALRSAGGKPGELAGDLNIEANSIVVLGNVQNPGSRQLGREIGTLRAEFYGLTGLSDATYVSFSNSFQWDEQHVGQIGHEFGIGASGLRFGMRGSYAESRPDITGLDLMTRSIITGIDLKYPLIRRVTETVTAGMGFEYSNQRTVLVNNGLKTPFSRDRISVAFARLDGSFSRPRSDGEAAWTLDTSVELRQGLGILKNTPRRTVVGGFSPTRFDGNSEATVVRGTLDASVRVGKVLWLTGSALGQWSSSALLNLEEFSLGNLTYGRGYDPGANGADRVVAFRVEPRVRVVDGEKFRLEVSGFYDNVRIWNLDRGTLETKRTIDSIGGGIRMTAANRFILDVTYAKPLAKTLATSNEPPTDRLLFSLTTKLLPWRSGR